MSTDALAAALAAEEHRQGRPYTADPEHCERCADIDAAWHEAQRVERRANCDHTESETVTLSSVGCGRHAHLVRCADCGVDLEQITEMIAW
jgi:hypothetical protein